VTRRMEDKVNEILAPRVLEKVLSDDEIKPTNWYATAFVDAEGGEIYPLLVADLSVIAIPQTTLIKISMTGRNPEEIALIIGKVADAAKEESGTIYVTGAVKKIATLKEEVRGVTRSRDEKISNLRSKRLAASRNTGSPKTALIHLNQLIANQIVVQVDLVEAVKALQMISNLTHKELVELPDILEVLRGDSSLYLLRQQVMGLGMELEIKRQKFGDQHKAVKDLADRHASYKRTYDGERKELQDETVNKLRQFRENSMMGLQEQFNSLSKQIKDKDEELRSHELALTNLAMLEDAWRADDRKLERLGNRLMELTTTKGFNDPMKIFKPASAPNKNDPYMPKLKVMLPLAIFLALFIAVGFAVLIEVLDTSIKTAGDVLRRVDLPVLGTIPHIDDIEDDVDELALAFVEDPSSVVAEAFRQIRMSLLYGQNEQQQRSIAVLSAMPEDGRTSVAANIALVAASAGKRILLIDANLRLPRMGEVFGVSSSRGLSTVLAGQDEWQSVVQEVKPNLTLLTAGPMPPNPAELLGSAMMGDLLKEWYQQYDQVIFDTTPCMLVSDSIALCTQVDGIVLVARAKVNTYGILQRCRDEIRRVGGTIFGVVVNGVRVTAGGYLRKNYESFYEYREQQMLPPTKTDDTVDIG
jgi:succinoglycan biosynthesis transport protein ExoP